MAACGQRGGPAPRGGGGGGGGAGRGADAEGSPATPRPKLAEGARLPDAKDADPFVPTASRRSRPPATLLRDVAVHTPMEESRWLSRIAGGPVFLKAENLQRAGSFKIRGAYVRMARLSRGGAGPRRGGGQRRQPRPGRRARRADARHPGAVFMPHGAPIVKEKATRGYGAEVRFHGQLPRRSPRGGPGARRDRRGARAPLRPRGHRGGPGDLRPGDPRAVRPRSAPSWCRPEAAACWPASPPGSSRSAPRSGSSACRPRAPRPTPRSLEQATRGLTSMATMADGIAIGRPGEVPFASVLRPRRRVRHVLRGVALPGAAAAHGAGQAGRRAGRCRRRRGRPGEPDPLRTPMVGCSREATSTRSCS